MTFHQEKFISPREEDAKSSSSKQVREEREKTVVSAEEDFKSFFKSEGARELVGDIYRSLYKPEDAKESAEHKRKVASQFLAVVVILQEMLEREASRPSFELREEGVQFPGKSAQEAKKRFEELVNFLYEMRIISNKNEVAQIISDELEGFLYQQYEGNKQRLDAGTRLLKKMEEKILRGVFLSQQQEKKDAQQSQSVEQKRLHIFMNFFVHELNLPFALRESNWNASYITAIPLFEAWRKKFADMIRNNENIGISRDVSKRMIREWGETFVEKNMGRLNEGEKTTIQDRMNRILDAILSQT